jgi:hypothetical protein
MAVTGQTPLSSPPARTARPFVLMSSLSCADGSCSTMMVATNIIAVTKQIPPPPFSLLSRAFALVSQLASIASAGE